MSKNSFKIVVVDGEGNRWSKEGNSDTDLWEDVATETNGLCVDGAKATVYRREGNRWVEDWCADGECLRNQLLRENYEPFRPW